MMRKKIIKDHLKKNKKKRKKFRQIKLKKDRKSQMRNQTGTWVK
jgi:hypothetical protein